VGMAAVHERYSTTGKPAAAISGDFDCAWSIWDAAMKSTHECTPRTYEEGMNYERNTPHWHLPALWTANPAHRTGSDRHGGNPEVDGKLYPASMCVRWEGSEPLLHFRQLMHLAPWSGPTLTHIDTAAGVAVMYLAREQHALPQLTE
jgi:hypothetical protein